MTWPQEGFYRGLVWHQRTQPKAHEFQYQTQMLFVNADHFGQWSQRSVWWSDKVSIWTASLLRKDFFGDEKGSIKSSVINQIRVELGDAVANQINRVFILCHARFFGYIMNPLTTYYCYNSDNQLVAIIALVKNTPWGEQFPYVFEAQDNEDTHIEFDKKMTVSPFNPLSMSYRWRSSVPNNMLSIVINTRFNSVNTVNAAIHLDYVPLSAQSMRNMVLAYPVHTIKVITAIYWQALKLWIKGVPFLGKQKQG